MLMDISRVVLSENAVKSQLSVGQTLALGRGHGSITFFTPSFSRMR